MFRRSVGFAATVGAAWALAACSSGGNHPSPGCGTDAGTDPSTLPGCVPVCGGAHCAPAATLGTGSATLLSSCTGGACAPDALVSASRPVAGCVSIAGAEGRCIPQCALRDQSRAAVLPVSSCASGERCVPCFDPTASDPRAPTGACTIGCDAPAKAPTVLSCPWTGPDVIAPSAFPDCGPACSGAHCLPPAAVPSSQQSFSTCLSGFCVPDVLVQTGGQYVPPSCVAFSGTNAEGRCLSTCLPGIAAQSTLEQSTCASDARCAPCTDPLKGTSTGACTIACDHPAQPPYTFPLCCAYQGAEQGTCVPSGQLSSSQRSNLSQEACPSQMLCLPDEYLPGGIPSTCTDSLGEAGACVSKCANIPNSFLLSQANCPANHLCVPCSSAPAGTPGC